MMRLGLKVPTTWMVPHKSPTPIPRFEYMAAKFADVASKYNAPFDLREIGEQVGYPLYMKPFDGGQWVGVTRIGSADELQAGYDASGERLMHLQAAVDDSTCSSARSRSAPRRCRALRPRRADARALLGRHEFLTPEVGREVVTISRLVNAFFRWEFNSCETLVKGGEVHPIDYANASPDVALTSLHYYFPWAIKTLVNWSAFCAVTDRPMRINQNTRDYFEIGDRDDLDYEEKLAEYRSSPTRSSRCAEYDEFCAAALADLDELAVEYFDSPEFDELLVATVTSTFPAHEHEAMVERHRGLVGAWVSDQR